MEPDDLYPRAPTRHAFTRIVPYSGGVLGELTLSIFRSTDETSRGGVVLRITSSCPSGDAYLAHAQPIPGGIEVHMAGEAEGKALLEALRTSIGELQTWELLGVEQPQQPE